MSENDKKQANTTRSPSPSALSTASSASPLIRSNSSTSGSSSTWNEASVGGKVSPSLRRPGPTSIAAAQLQQQQQQVVNSSSGGGSGRSKKLASGNKLAHMSHGSGAGLPAAQSSPKHTTKGFGNNSSKSTAIHVVNNEKSGGTSAKSFAHDFGKSIAYKAFRFNEFWSANKLRYLNLACLLMTLVCLLTILLFSRSSSSPSSQSTLTSGDVLRNNKVVDQLMSDTADTSDESIDSLDRQPFVRAAPPLSSSYKRTIDDETSDSLDASEDDRVRQVDEARRQLKRQQDGEREAEDTTTSSSMPTSSSTPPAATQQADDLLADLDPAFGLLKSIKSQLLGGVANLTSMGKPIVRRTKNGATIIMSFGGALNETELQQRNSSSTGPLNLFEKLLGLGSPMRAGSAIMPMFPSPSRFDSMEADESQMDESQPSNQFATITINSSPFAHILRPANQMEGPLVNPFMSPAAMLSAPRPFIMSTSGGDTQGPPGGFLDMIMRASSDLADRMQRQAALNSTQKATNQTAPTAAKNETAEESSGPEVETFDVGKLLASRRSSPFAMRSIYSSPPRRPAGAMIMISSSGSSGSPSDSSMLSGLAPPPPPPFAFMSPMRQIVPGDSADNPMSPMLRAILGAGLMRPMEQRRRWDEPTTDKSSGDDWEERESGSSSNGRVSGTIRQIFRGPGVTVERVIRLPTGRAAEPLGQSSSVSSRWSTSSTSELDDSTAAAAEATAVPRGLRSQSLSSRADTPEDSPLRSLVPPISLPIGQLIGRIFNDLNRRADLMNEDSSDPLDTPTSSSFLAGMPRPTGAIFAPRSFTSGARQPRAFDQSDDNEMLAEPSTLSVGRHLQQQQQQQNSDDNDDDHRWSPKIRLGSARLRISPRSSDPFTLPQRFTMVARPPPQELSAMARIERVDHARASPSFTSPSSPLFGFPALKSSAPIQSPPAQEKRPFKYHSNHEVAGSQQQQVVPPAIESRSSNQLRHRSGVASLPAASAAAAVGMGRRLDEDELTSA